MSVTIDLAPEVEETLRQEAARQGLDTGEFARSLIERALSPRVYTARELLAMTPEWRAAYLQAAADDAAPLYDADLACPAHERELTAFTALDGEPFLEYDGTLSA